MDNKTPIDWKIAYQELTLICEFLKQRNLQLAHNLALAQMQIENLSNPAPDMVNTDDGISK